MMDLKEGEIASRNIILLKVILFFLQLIVGFLSGSIVILAAALDSISDVVGLFASWFGLKIAQKQANEKFPYGYYKAESLATTTVSLVILYFGFNLFIKGINAFYTPKIIKEPILAMSLAFFSIFIALFLVKYLETVAKKINSSSLMANAQEKRIDILSSILVFLAVFANNFGILYLEAIVTILISLWVIKFGIENTLKSIYSLMDVSPSNHIDEKIKEIIASQKQVKKFKNLKIRKSGPLVFGEVEIEIASTIDVSKAHRITEEIEQEIKLKVPEVIHFTIHIEPSKITKSTIAIPVINNEGFESKISPGFTNSPFFAIVDSNFNCKIIKNSFNKKDNSEHSVADLIVDMGVNVVLIKKIEEIAFHTLSDQMVEIYTTNCDKVGEALKNYSKGKLNKKFKPC